MVGNKKQKIEHIGIVIDNGVGNYFKYLFMMPKLSCTWTV